MKICPLSPVTPKFTLGSLLSDSLKNIRKTKKFKEGILLGEKCSPCFVGCTTRARDGNMSSNDRSDTELGLTIVRMILPKLVFAYFGAWALIPIVVFVPCFLVVIFAIIGRIFIDKEKRAPIGEKKNDRCNSSN